MKTKLFLALAVDIRRILFLLPSAFIALSAFAIPKNSETIDTCRMCVLYKYHIATLDREHKNVTDTVKSILEIGDNMAKYGDHRAYVYRHGYVPEELSHLQVDHYDARINAWTYVYQHIDEGTMQIREFVHPCYYVYDEDTPAEWRLHEGTATILGYKCYRATLSYGGRMWTAWYAPDLQVSAGPWKLCGLPGLVLKAEDDSGTHRFEAYALFAMPSTPIVHDTDASDTKTTRNKFIQHRNKIKQDERYMDKPYFHDPSNVSTVIHSREIYEKHGASLNINGVLYPTVITGDGYTSGLMSYMFNYFQPLELK